jgi:predicted DsbA family dithiol-disulfide isomerase
MSQPKYTSQVSMTLDTICPWTYIAKRRLDAALVHINTLPEVTDHVTFTPVLIRPYQLDPTFPEEAVSSYTWYRDNKFSGSDERTRMFRSLMAEHGKDMGITFSSLASDKGVLANTFDAHRVLQQVQGEKGPEMAGRVLEALYRGYFEEGKHPSSKDALVGACVEAEMSEEEAKQMVEEKGSWTAETKRLIREQISEGVDGVPSVRIEGKRRDLTLVGARSVDEYVKALVTIAKESR